MVESTVDTDSLEMIGRAYNAVSPQTIAENAIKAVRKYIKYNEADVVADGGNQNIAFTSFQSNIRGIVDNYFRV